ncbi:protein toll [Manduca sexta]|uniref:protein toll n=1 Tax=Manduca sexta TaxID=7130 RepID=UPI00188FF1EC|nr:protein toll [Manduca sexta]
MQAWRWWCTTLLLALVPGLAGGSNRPECASNTYCKFAEESFRREFFYNVSGLNVRIKFTDALLFDLSCDNLALDDPNLPRFSSVVRVNKVNFENCTPPRNGSFANAIAALNVTSFSSLSLDKLPPKSVIKHEHLAGLQQLEKFSLYGSNNASLAPGALAALSVAPALHNLYLNWVHTPAADLVRLPQSLQKLLLWDVDAVSGYFQWLPNLTSLYVSEKYPIAVDVSNNTALKTLSVIAPDTVISENALPPTLTTLKLRKWNDTKPKPKTRCAQLEVLMLTGTDNERYPVSLPDEWLSSCIRLRELYIYNVPVRGVLPARLLAKATALKDISIKYCNLSALPQGFLDDTLNLTKLDLSNNKLTSLPSGLFLRTKLLEELNLSHNLLISAVAEALSVVFSLRNLRLNNNNIGDLCLSGSNSTEPADTSMLRNLTNLHSLYLSYTNVSRVCYDWRVKLLNLKKLDLNNSAVTTLTCDDLHYSRVTTATVMLGKYKLLCQRRDYDKSLASYRINAFVTLDGSLVCDCNTYWAARVFQNNVLDVITPQCKNYNYHKSIANMNHDNLTCSASEECAALPASCTCRKRDDHEHGSVVIVRCVGLTEFPRLPRQPDATHKWRLHLANNSISHIDAADILENIVELDLRNNFIRRVDGATATNLTSVLQLQLAGNPLECGCEAYTMLRALLEAKSLVDKKDVRCNGTGQRLVAVTPTACPGQGLMSVLPWVLPLVVLLAVAIFAYGFITRPATRLWIKFFLMRLGWIPRPFEPADEDRPYDAFVSFAHEDEELVVEQLAARLESGPQPYRLCLHYRDWAPGEWIPAQIAASVRASRRTVAIVSTHYLQSDWARAEFREATAASLRDGTPRLVVVLLDDPDRLMLEVDAELSAYVRHKVYVRWGDPWFWEKLKQALPLPRARHLKSVPSFPASAPDIPLVLTHAGRETALAPAPPSQDYDKPMPGATLCST